MRPANERRRYSVTPSHSLRAYTEWPLNSMRIHSLLGPANDEVPLWDISPHHCLYNILPVAVRMLPGSWTPWWRHQMETLSALLAFVLWIQRSPVNSPHKGQWRGALLFSLICSWINGWVNNGEAGDFRRHSAHYDVITMQVVCDSYIQYMPWYMHTVLLLFALLNNC